MGKSAKQNRRITYILFSGPRPELFARTCLHISGDSLPLYRKFTKNEILMTKVIRKIGLVAHDAMKKDMIEWVLWNSERLIGHKFYCTGTTGTFIKKALEEKHPDIEWDITLLKSGPLGGDQQIGSRIVEGEIDYLFFFTDPMTLQPHDTDVKALTRLAGVENIVFCCNRSTADHIITSPLFTDPTYERIHPDYTNYAQRFANRPIVSEAVEQVKKRKNRKKSED